ncbi:hypothetical protein MMC30_006714 [Trapelia coarctata]|nr:hypothetical protein [Trapelia coarctata]
MHLQTLLLPLLLPHLFLAAATPKPKQPPASPRCRAGLQAFTSRLHIPPHFPKLKPRRDLEATLDPATDPQIFPIPQEPIPLVTSASSPRARTNLLQSHPLALNPVEGLPRDLGLVRPDQIASMDDHPLDWCGYLTPTVLNGERRHLFLDTSTYWVIFYVINMAPDSSLTLLTLDLDQDTPTRHTPRFVTGQHRRLLTPGWGFMPAFQAWRGKEYILTLRGGDRGWVYWYLATQ